MCVNMLDKGSNFYIKSLKASIITPFYVMAFYSLLYKKSYYIEYQQVVKVHPLGPPDSFLFGTGSPKGKCCFTNILW